MLGEFESGVLAVAFSLECPSSIRIINNRDEMVLGKENSFRKHFFSAGIPSTKKHWQEQAQDGEGAAENMYSMAKELQEQMPKGLT